MDDTISINLFKYIVLTYLLTVNYNNKFCAITQDLLTLKYFTPKKERIDKL